MADWRKLQTSDHFYYMCTKYFADGDVHKYFNPYDSPYDSYINFMNVLNNLHNRCSSQAPLDTDNVSDKTLMGKSYLTKQAMEEGFCTLLQNKSGSDLQMVN